MEQPSLTRPHSSNSISAAAGVADDDDEEEEDDSEDEDDREDFPAKFSPKTVPAMMRRASGSWSSDYARLLHQKLLADTVEMTRSMSSQLLTTAAAAAAGGRQ